MFFKNILVTTDFSDTSKAAFDTASYFAKMDGSQVTLFNSFQKFFIPAEFSGAIWSYENMEKMEKEYLKNSKERLSEFVEKNFHGQEVKTVSLATDDSADEAICNYAKEHNIDLIIISSHGRGALKSLVLGSTAQKVLQKASCPVLVVKNEN